MKKVHTKTKIIAITFLASLFFTSINAQNAVRDIPINISDIPNTISDIPVLDSPEIAKAVSYFKINNNSLEGNGADILEQYIASSKFFVLGEYHYSREISKLTESLVPLLDKSGYKAAAFEVGPVSADKLKELSRVPDSTRAKLKAFNAKYFVPSMKMSAIPMFWSVPDAGFLKAFSETKMEIFGVDQEFTFSVLFLGDEMVKSKLNDPNYQEIKAAWEKAKKTIEVEFKNPKREILSKILTNPDFQQFEKMFDSDDQYAQNILKRLHETWHIYESSGWSHKDRIDYIRSNFLRNYYAIEKENKDARYFIKIGYKHAAKTNFSIGCYDIGTLTQEIAELEQVKSANVIVARATYGDKDYRDDEASSLVNFHKKDRWTIIDLKSLRDKLNSNKFQIITHADYQGLNRMIMGFDLLLIPPVDKRPVDNW